MNFEPDPDPSENTDPSISPVERSTATGAEQEEADEESMSPLDESGVDESGVDESVVDKSGVDESVVDESVVDEPDQGEPEVVIPPPAQDIEKASLRKQVEENEIRLRAISNGYRTLQAEFAAFRERTERLQDERDRLRRGETVTVIFEPVQNLRRSLQALERMEVAEEVRQGLEMVFNQFMNAMQKLGLEEIPAQGLNFDPNLHEALASVPVPSGELDGKIIQVFDTGYRIGSLVVQPARVVVGVYREPQA